MSQAPPTQTSAPTTLTSAEWAVIGLFVALGLVLASWVGYRSFTTPTAPAVPTAIDEMAKKYLRERKAAPLSETLSRLLANPGPLVPTQTHALLGQPAPDFTLPTHDGRAWSLARDGLQQGPLVL